MEGARSCEAGSTAGAAKGTQCFHLYFPTHVSHFEIKQESLEVVGKGHLYDQWLGMLFASSRTPNGGNKPLSTNIMSEQVAFFHREGVDFRHITDEITVKIDKEFESSEMPIGF